MTSLIPQCTFKVLNVSLQSCLRICCGKVKHELRVASYKLKSTSFEFKSTSYEFKSTTFEFKFMI